MSDSLFETIRRIVREELGQVRTAELGVVQEQHPHAETGDSDNYACSVVLRDSGIVLKQVPVATPRIGAAMIPAVGELVLVQFIGGDRHAPVITGRLYNDQERPPLNADGQAVLHLPLGAGDGDAVHIELLSGDTRELTIRLGDGLALSLKDDDPVAELTVNGGKASLSIDRDGTVTVESGGDLKINGNSVTIEAVGELKLKGATINLN